MPTPPPNERLLKQALEWFFLLQSENCTDENKQKFNHWYCKSETNQKAYAHAEYLWSDLNQLKKTTRIPGLEEARRPRSKRRAVRALGMAALMLISSALVSVGWMEYHTETVTYSTQLGEKRTITLSDGSMVDLNTATRLHAKISLLQRHIKLDSGEAIFDVQHERVRSFNVQTDQLTIRDIGTRFSVRLQNDDVLVAVLQGAVEINGERMDEGYQRWYQSGLGFSHQQSTDIAQIEAWKQGRLIFRQAAVKEVVTELERYHPVRFVFADPSIALETLSGTFGSDNLELFLNSLVKILPIKVSRLPDEQTLLIEWAQKK